MSCFVHRPKIFRLQLEESVHVELRSVTHDQSMARVFDGLAVITQLAVLKLISLRAAVNQYVTFPVSASEMALAPVWHLRTFKVNFLISVPAEARREKKVPFVLQRCFQYLHLFFRISTGREAS